MHTQQRLWCEGVKQKFPSYFTGKKVLEIGSANINGDLRYLFTDCEYIGIDVAPYGGVDVVSVAHEYDVPDGSFDVVYSASSLEHDMYWQKTLPKMTVLTKQEGLMFFSCGSTWSPHGCNLHMPEHSLSSKISEEWANYYKNITVNDVVSVLDLTGLFREWQVGLDSGMDLTFWGVRR